MPLLNNAQRAALRRAQAAANETLPRLEYLQQIAAIHPPLASTVQGLRDRRDWVYQMATLMLELDRQSGNG